MFCCAAARNHSALSFGIRSKRVEVDIDQPEPAAVAVDLLEVVLGAREEVPVHRYTVRGGALQLAEAGTAEHHTVGSLLEFGSASQAGNGAAADPDRLVVLVDVDSSGPAEGGPLAGDIRRAGALARDQPLRH